MKNSVRITAGKYRGREILTPGAGTHPMGSRERLALFNSISASLPGAAVLDAFAGSGALGIEALSRGAKFAVFVEKSPAAARVIKENLAKLELDERSEVIVGDLEKYFTAKRFNLILADPPYDDFNANIIVQLTKFLDENGILVLSHPGDALELGGLRLAKTTAYAGARISIYYR